MKQRLVVMNGQCLVQREQGGEWKILKVRKAGELRPDIYNLDLARPADKALRHEGIILHVDADNVFQKIERQYVRHAVADFARLPDPGVTRIITYDGDGKAQLNEEAKKPARRRRAG